MSLFKNLFGKSDPVAELGKLHARREWAALLTAARRLERGSLPPEVQAQVSGWEVEAGDQLAQVNLDEADGALRLGNIRKAMEHLQLAQQQARSAALGERVAQGLAALAKGAPAAGVAAVKAEAAGCGGGCGPSCAPAASAPAEEADLDAEGQLELLLATLPAELAAQYAAAGPTFLQGWLAAQEGEDARALELFDKVPDGERGPLFRAERGVLLARTGKAGAAEKDLRVALQELPDFFPAFDAMATVLATTRRYAELEQLLRAALAAGRFPGYCWTGLAQIEAGRGNLDAALEAGSNALAAGATDQDTIVFCAQLHERAGHQEAAEAVLTRLPSGGCGGGAHPLLAEHWLRHGKNLDRALESFKGALRHEMDNPRWLLRIAQVYIAKGWKKDAAGPIDSLLQRPGLPEALAAEVRAAATALNKG
jgi:tetratricopeptide (TPR) repeat protein